jgi:plasmid replication initiation protein
MAIKQDKKNKLENISENNWIVKSNTLNEIRDNKMTPSQLRFFSIYLSKINPQNQETRLVTFPLNEYTKIMQFKQLNITRIHQTAEELLSLTATFKETDNNGNFSGMTICQLFKRFKLFKDDNNCWFVSIDCHDDVLPYMFSFKKYYFKYQLWNALRLGTVNQLRMYEILKQYEIAGAREVSLNDLRNFLGIGKDEYPRWDNFRRRVLDSCQQALSENTDIKFSYEPIKRGRGGKITAIRFAIEKNNDYIDQLTLDEFIESQSDPEVDGELYEINFENEKLEFLADACNNEFSESEMQILYDLILQIIPYGDNADFERYHYLQRKYNELIYRAEKTKINSRFGYLKSIIHADIGGDK